MKLLRLLCCMYAASFTFMSAQNLPDDFNRVEVTDGLTSPTAFIFSPDKRIFVTEQGGTLRVVKNGVLLEDPAITLTVSNEGERGLIGLALHPDFENNEYIYLYYTVPAGTERTAAFNKIVRYTFDGDVINTATAQTILELDDLEATNHNGGAMNFGPDGKLYIAVGENAEGSNAQDLDNYLGKLLRLNADGSVPEDNPFSGSAARSRIWAYGLRNPYTFTFDPSSGKLFVNDVGQGTWEEINDATAGGMNFGWPAKEGFCSSGCEGYEDPVYVYGHGEADNEGCSIVGGTFFNPASTNYPASYLGQYFFNDYCGSWINSINPEEADQGYVFGTDLGGGLTYLLTGPEGDLYYLSRSDGALYQIVYTGTTTAISSSAKESAFQVAPNPCRDKVVLTATTASEQHMPATLYNSYGKVMATGIVLPDSGELDMSDYPAGMYILSVDGAGVRIIKE